jgi:hypothetical protein
MAYKEKTWLRKFTHIQTGRKRPKRSEKPEKRDNLVIGIVLVLAGIILIWSVVAMVPEGTIPEPEPQPQPEPEPQPDPEPHPEPPNGLEACVPDQTYYEDESMPPEWRKDGCLCAGGWHWQTTEFGWVCVPDSVGVECTPGSFHESTLECDCMSPNTWIEDEQGTTVGWTCG